MRFFFLLMVLAGAALGIAYPWAASNVTGYEVGTWRVFERGSGFTPADVSLAPSETPVAVTLDLRADGALIRSDTKPLLTIDVSGDGEFVSSVALDFTEAEVRTINPQSGETGYRIEAERLHTVDHSKYRFELGPGVAGTERFNSVDLIVNAGAFDLDARAIPAGFILMALGLLGFVASFFRRGRPENPNSSPPPPRWGRGK
ncbi:MAG: hypothetical protein JJ911_08000 [Rhizobiaceae bacterium]|nr:hypothetical protein [Rhizobiaceae bacterium]